LKSVICPFDAKSGMLCSNRESKLESRSVTRDEADAAIKLARLADRDEDVEEFTLMRGAKWTMISCSCLETQT
jgi:hypothetical protein